MQITYYIGKTMLLAWLNWLEGKYTDTIVDVLQDGLGHNLPVFNCSPALPPSRQHPLSAH